MGLFDVIDDKIKGKGIKIVLPEGNDIRVVGAAIRLLNDEMIHPIVQVSELATNVSSYFPMEIFFILS